MLRIRRSRSKRCQTGEPPGRPADKVRADHQPQDRTQLPPAWLQASIGQPPTLLASLRSARILGPRRLELLRELLPPGATVAVLRNRTNAICDAESSEIEAAAPLLRLRLGVMTINAGSLSELDSAFVSIQTEVSGLLTNDALLKYSTAILAVRWRGAGRRKGRYSGPYEVHLINWNMAASDTRYSTPLHRAYRMLPSVIGSMGQPRPVE